MGKLEKAGRSGTCAQLWKQFFGVLMLFRACHCQIPVAIIRIVLLFPDDCTCCHVDFPTILPPFLHELIITMSRFFTDFPKLFSAKALPRPWPTSLLATFRVPASQLGETHQVCRFSCECYIVYMYLLKMCTRNLWCWERSCWICHKMKVGALGFT